MAVLTATFEAGVHGNNVTTGAGEASATKWDSIFGTAPTYDNTRVAHGGLSCRLPSNTQCVLQWDFSSTGHYGRFYCWLPGTPTFQHSIMLAYNGGTPILGLSVNDNAKMVISDSVGATLASTASVPTGQWIRMEYHVVHSATVGQIEAKLFNSMDSSSPTEVLTSPATWNTAAAATAIRFGNQNGTYASGVASVDDIVANATDYPGPIPTTFMPPPRMGRVRGG